MNLAQNMTLSKSPYRCTMEFKSDDWQGEYNRFLVITLYTLWQSSLDHCLTGTKSLLWNRNETNSTPPPFSISKVFHNCWSNSCVPPLNLWCPMLLSILQPSHQHATSSVFNCRHEILFIINRKLLSPCLIMYFYHRGAK